MKERFLDIVKWSLIIVIAILAYSWINPYTIIGSQRVAYKMHRIMGKVWLIAGDKEMIVEPKTSIKQSANKFLNRRGETNIPEEFVLDDETK